MEISGTTLSDALTFPPDSRGDRTAADDSTVGEVRTTLVPDRAIPAPMRSQGTTANRLMAFIHVAQGRRYALTGSAAESVITADRHEEIFE